MLNTNRYRTPAEKVVVWNGYIPSYISPEVMDFCNYLKTLNTKKP